MPFKEHTFQDVLNAIQNSGKHYNLEEIRKAYDFAATAHEGQFRKSGERYINHPVSVAIILIGLGMDADTIKAAFLHDVVEDTEFTDDDIRREFGDDVSMLVSGVTKLKKIPHATR